jgi:hypothetical protein
MSCYKFVILYQEFTAVMSPSKVAGVLSKAMSGPVPETESWNSKAKVDGCVSPTNNGTGIGPWLSFTSVWLSCGNKFLVKCEHVN